MTATQSQIRDALDRLHANADYNGCLQDFRTVKSALDTQKPAGDVDTDRDDDPAEAAYWRFDARRKGYKPYLHVGERDAFKQEYRNALTGKPKDGGDLSGIDLERLSRLNNRKGRLCYQGVDGHYNIGYKNPADRTFVLEVLKSVEKILTADNAKRGE